MSAIKNKNGAGWLPLKKLEPAPFKSLKFTLLRALESRKRKGEFIRQPTRASQEFFERLRKILLT